MAVNLTGTLTTRTVGGVVAAARVLLNDPEPSTGSSLSGTNVAAGRTLGSAIVEVRGLINDITAPFRYPDTDLYTYMTDAFLMMRRLRPDLFISPVVVPIYTPSNSSTLFPVAEEYYPTVVSYVSALAEWRDDTSTTDGKTSALLEGFNKSLLARPFRHDDADLYHSVSNALAETRRLRPDMFLGAGLRIALPVYTAADSATPFPVDDRYYLSYVYYVVGDALSADGSLMKDTEPATYLQLFVSGVMT